MSRTDSPASRTDPTRPGTDNPTRMSRHDCPSIPPPPRHESRINQVQDMAAALTYYAVLATFPALLATLAALGIFGSAEAVTEDVLRVVEDLGGSSVI